MASGIIQFSSPLVPLTNHSRWTLDGDSITALSGWSGWWCWCWLLSGGKLYLPPGGRTATGGATTDTVISRLSTDESFSSKLFSLMIGTNNVGAVIPGLQTIYAGMIGAGARINAIPILPKNAGLDSDQTAANTYIATLTTQNFVITSFQNIFDPNPSAVPPMSDDGLHPNLYGAYVIGNSWAQLLSIYLTGSSILPTSVTGENLCVNPLVTGTGGTITGGTGCSGVVADNWDLFWNVTGTATCVASKGTLSTGQPAQVFTTSGTGSGFTVFSQAPSVSGQIGDNFEMWCCVEWSGTGIVGVACGGNYFNGGDVGTVGSPIQSPITGGVMRAIPVTLVAPISSLGFNIQCQCDNNSNAVFKVGQVMVRKVPNGQ